MSDVVAVAEHRDGALRPVSHEVAACGAELAEATGGAVHVLLVGDGATGLAERLDHAAIERIHVVEDDAAFDHAVTAAAVGQLVADLGARYVVAPHSVNGMDYAPAVAEDLGVALVTDVVDLELDGGLAAVREMYGSKVETTVAVADERAVVTVREGAWEPLAGGGTPQVGALEVDVGDRAGVARVIGYEEMAAGDVDITEADVLDSVGRGIGEEENL
ncbi:MAG: electron transfer flavoprotein subunit alpha/FixB family protein, partial [Halobacteriales archaeon]